MSSEQQHRTPSISLDNYEEYFLLYMDQELSDADKKDVESFLEQHPELKEELNQLLLTKCLPDNTPVFDKSSLLKNHVDAANVESLQLMLIDDELDVDTKRALEDYQTTHPAAQENLDILRQAKLPVEQIVFPYKEKLLRNNHGRIITLRRISYSVAASLILFLGLRIFLPEKTTQNNFTNLSSGTLASDQKTIKAITINQPVKKEIASQNIAEIEGMSNHIKTSEPQSASVRNKLRGQMIAAAQNNRSGHITSTTKTIIVSETVAFEKTNHFPEVEANTNQLPARDNAAKTNNLPVRETNLTGSSASITSSTVAAATDFDEPIKDNYATEALTNVRFANYREQEEDENEEERKGFKNIIRKANRLYNKVTHPEPDKTIFRFTKTDIGIPR